MRQARSATFKDALYLFKTGACVLHSFVWYHIQGHISILVSLGSTWVIFFQDILSKASEDAGDMSLYVV